MDPSYELFDHTADLGVRVRAGTQAELVAPAVAGLYEAMSVAIHAEPVVARTFDFAGDDAAVLLRDFLAELLYVFEREGLCAVATDVRSFDDAQLNVAARLAPVEGEEAAGREVKAITYHELVVRRVEDGYEAVYIVDI